jgi:hypothetical protein
MNMNGVLKYGIVTLELAAVSASSVTELAPR